MATTFVDPLLQLREYAGTGALSGAKIYTYEAGTTTPLATYTDLAGASANTNPVILDSAGMAVIRQTDGVAYKWVVHDSDDNLLTTRDNITVGVSASASAQDYIVHMTYVGTPGAQSFMGGLVFEDSITFPVDLEGSQGSVQTLPGASYVVSIQKNDVEVAQATIDTAGSYTFTTTGSSTVSFASGDKLTFIAPDSGTAADFIMTLAGSVD